MTEHAASRTLVKSPPELWAECSDAASLARHLDRFGEIRITRLEPETTVAWEGDHVTGTLRLEPSGWGTRVVLTATPDADMPVAEGEKAPGPTADGVASESEPEPAPGPEPEPPAPDPEPPWPEPKPEPEPDPLPPAAAAESRPAQTTSRLFDRLLERFGSWRSKRPVLGSEPLTPETPLPAPLTPAAPRPEPQAAQSPLARAPAGPGETGEPGEPGEPGETGEPGDTGDPGETTTRQALAAALESLGQAHHRPYSRA